MHGKSPCSESISPVGTTPKIGEMRPVSCSVIWEIKEGLSAEDQRINLAQNEIKSLVDEQSRLLKQIEVLGSNGADAERRISRISAIEEAIKEQNDTISSAETKKDELIVLLKNLVR